MDSISPPSSPDYEIPSHQELLDFWGPILSTPTGQSVGITTAPSNTPPSGVPLPKDSDSDDFDIESESDSDSDSDAGGLSHEETAAFWGGLLPGSTSFSIHGPLLSNKDDSDDSDFESEVDDEEMEDIALDEAFEFAQDEDDEAREFLDEPRKLAQEKKMKEEAAKEKWSKLKLPQLKEECEKRGLARSGLKAWLVERLVEDDLEKELEMNS